MLMTFSHLTRTRKAKYHPSSKFSGRWYWIPFLMIQKIQYSGLFSKENRKRPTRDIYCVILISVCIAVWSGPLQAQDVGQQFEGFNLQGYTDSGELEWDVNGDTADIMGDTIEITNVDANRYGDQKMNLKAKKGIMNRTSGNVYLEKDVVITAEDGRRLMTDSLDWKKDEDLVVTDDKVILIDKGMVATGTGLEARPGLMSAKMQKDVTIDIEMDNAENSGKDKVHITCDGPMEIDQKNNKATLSKNVVAIQKGQILKADKLEVYFDPDTQQIKQMVCTGNVEIIQGANSTFSQRAIYNAIEQKIILTGRPKLIFVMEQADEDEEEKP